MKINPKYLLLFSFLPCALIGNSQLFGGQSKEKIEQWEKAIDECNKSIKTVNDEIVVKENKKTELHAQLDEKKQEENRLQKEIDKINNVIEYLEGNQDPNADKKDKYLKLSEELDTLKNKMAELSTNFLFTPYEQYCIDVVARPDFQMGKGSLYYQQYSYRGDMLNHYKQDWENLKKFLETNKLTTSTTAGEVRTKLLNYPTYLQYAGGKNPKTGNDIPGYGEGWEQTYLGNIMSGLLKVLKEAKGPEATAKIISAFETYLNMMK